jgi:hypothetical protein
MTQLRSGRQASQPNSVKAHELKLPLKVHHREERHALSGADPGPAGFDFALQDDDPGAEPLRALLSRGFTGRRV